MALLRYTRDLFLRAVCVVYLSAFISFYVQIPGLYGDNGILPAKAVLENSKHKTFADKVHYEPTLLWIASYIGLDTNYALDLLALLGSFLAFTGFVSQKFCTIPLFAGLWSLYFSLYQVGQVFVTSQWDDLLLEAGFLCLLVAPLIPRKPRGLKVSPCDKINMWLVKWLLFRLIFSNGIVKLISGCPKWWDLTGLSYQFESMVLPTPLSWYAHHLPLWFLKLTTVYVHVTELALPFLFFIPVRSVRVTGFVIQMFLQICTILTGNFNFRDLLTVALLISLLDDNFFYNIRNAKNRSRVIPSVFNILLHAAICVGVYFLYQFSYSEKTATLDVKVNFTKAQFDQALQYAVVGATFLGSSTLFMTILHALAKSINEYSGAVKYRNIAKTILFAGIALLLFSGGLVPLQSLHKSTNSTIQTPQRTIYNRLHKLRAINEYGTLFKKTVGVGGRPEIVLEGANHIDGPWMEYNFLYKPGNVNHSLPFVAPFSPRLDWQMWWAATSKYQKESWIMSLAHRLLDGRPEVLALLGPSPFPMAPKYIRATLYTYKFAPANEKFSWWRRERVGEYFPAFTKTTPLLVEHLAARNLLPTPSKEAINPIWKQIFEAIRLATNPLEGTLLLWSVFLAGCIVIATSSKMK